MSVSYQENALTAEALAGLRTQAGWSHTLIEQAHKALDHTIYSISAFDEGEIVGMGRLVGDGAMVWYIQDVIVLPPYRQVGVGSTIVRKLTDYAVKESMPGTNIAIALMSAKDKEPFYEKLGFVVRPNDHEGAGMMMRVKVPDLP